jgi:hypothetical protein
MEGHELHGLVLQSRRLIALQCPSSSFQVIQVDVSQVGHTLRVSAISTNMDSASNLTGIYTSLKDSDETRLLAWQLRSIGNEMIFESIFT